MLVWYSGYGSSRIVHSDYVGEGKVLKLVKNGVKISKNEQKWAVSLENGWKVSRTVGNGSGYEVELENEFTNMKNGSQMIKND